MPTRTHPSNTSIECPDCGEPVSPGDTNPVGDAHETICPNCNVVINEQAIDHGPEWRSYDNETGDPSRTGGGRTETMHNHGLGSVIGYSQSDANGNTLSPKQRSRSERHRWITEREATSRHESTLRFAFGEIDRLTDRLELPDSVHEEACRLFRALKNTEKGLRGKSIETACGAVVMLAARTYELFRSYQDIASVGRCELDQLKREYLRASRELNAEIKPLTPSDYIEQILGRANRVTPADLYPGVAQRAHDLVDAVEAENYHVGKQPSGLTVAIVYAAVRDEYGETGVLTQQDAGEIVDVSQVTIRKHFQNMPRPEHDESERAATDERAATEVGADAGAERAESSTDASDAGPGAESETGGESGEEVQSGQHTLATALSSD